MHALWVAVLLIATRPSILSDFQGAILGTLHQITYGLNFFVGLLPAEIIYLLFPEFESNFNAMAIRTISQILFSAIVWTPIVLGIEYGIRLLKGKKSTPVQ